MIYCPFQILLCDKCDAGFHTACLRPPLMIIPDGDWYCPTCEHVRLTALSVSPLTKPSPTHAGNVPGSGFYRVVKHSGKVLLFLFFWSPLQPVLWKWFRKILKNAALYQIHRESFQQDIECPCKFEADLKVLSQADHSPDRAVRASICFLNPQIFIPNYSIF